MTVLLTSLFFLLYAYFFNQTIFFFFNTFLVAPHAMWDLSSPTRDGTHVPCIGSKES